MRPGDHPEFFRFPAPEGRSRESTIRLDAQGRFFHDGALVEHEKLARALATWIDRHPDDGRYILTNGYDWTYLEVEDVPFFVHALHPDLRAILSDGSEEPLQPEDLRLLPDGGVLTHVKRSAARGPFEAKFDRGALVDLAGLLVTGDDGKLRLGPAGPVLLGP